MPLVLILLFFLFPAGVSALEVTVDEGFRHTEITRGVQYWLTDDPTAKPPAPDSEEWLLSDDTLTLGFEERTLWLLFTVRNSSDEDHSLILDIGFPLLDEVDVDFRVTGHRPQQYELGDTRPLNEKSIRHPHIIAPLRLGAGDAGQVTLRVYTTGAMSLPLTLWDNAEFIQASQIGIAWYVLIYGVLIGISIYHLLLYVQMRERSFLWFALFLVCLVGVFSFFQGILTTYVIPQARDYSNQILIWLYSAATGFCSIYILRLLNVRTSRPGYALSLYALIGIGVILSLLSFFIAYSVMIRLVTVYVMVSLVIVMAVQIRRALDHNAAAYYAMTATVFCAIGMVVTLLEKTGYMTSTVLTRSAGDIGFTLMALSYALMLSYRMRWEHLERKRAQQASYDLQANLLAEQTRHNKELEQLVEARTSELRKANAQLLELSTTDPLTGLYNRRYLDEYFTTQYALLVSMGEPLGILLMDIDHFKRINDTYGHPVGDQCLTEVAGRIQKVILKKGYMAARYGGEEFIIIMPGADAQQTRQLADRLLEIMRTEPVRVQQQDIRVTASIGALSAIPQVDTDPDTLLRDVDEYLYDAKNQGRDRAVFHIPELSSDKI